MALPTNTSSEDDGQKPSGLPRPNSDSRESGPVGYQAPRGGLPTPTPMARPVAPPPPPPEDDVFEQLSPDEAVIDEEEDGFESFDVFSQPEAPYSPPPSPVEPEVSIRRESDLVTAPPSSQDEVEQEEKDFINAKQKKLSPFGGAKSKKGKAKGEPVSKFDSREDRRTKALAVQGGVLALLVGIVGFGAYNALNPPQGVTAEEVNAAIAQAVTNSNFPKERGAAFATSFVGAYLTTDGTNPQKEEILAYYYTGVLGGADTGPNPASFADATQRILSGPQVYSYTPVSAETAAYTVGALVEVVPTDPEALEDLLASGETPPVKWVYYNVNVYYDSTTEAMAVTPNSPSLIPPPTFGPADSIPEAKVLGTGKTDEALTEQVRGPINNFFLAFAQSSPVNYEALENLVVGGANAGPDLLQGLDGKFRLAGDPAEAITYVAYVGEESTPASPQVKAEVTVTWEDATFPEDGPQITYTSTYFVELVKQSESSPWLVATVAPRFYLVAPNE